MLAVAFEGVIGTTDIAIKKIVFGIIGNGRI
jgi:hypothetical protein